MKISDLNGKTVCVLGYGREGQAVVDALQIFAPDAQITVADENQELRIEKKNVKTHMGDEWLSWLHNYDVIIKSPGIPPFVLPSDPPHPHVITPTQIFFETIRDSGATVIGVTGSKGKSTTASLIHHMLKSSKLEARSYLIGNIGEPAISHLADAKPGTVFVMEMSSYQLMNLQRSPHIAVITSFFPEHLDYHGSVEAYQDAKKNITRHQSPEDLAFFCASSYGATEIAKEGDGIKIPFTAEDAPVDIEETNLIGVHNLSNIAGASAVAMKLGIPEQDIIAAIKTFHGLPHRLQSLGVHDGIEWIDDAISTTPESAIAALNALGERVTTVILGGQDRGYDFTSLGAHIATSSVKTVILFPGSGPRIKKAIEEAQARVTFFEAKDMEEAVKIAGKQQRHGELAESMTASNHSEHTPPIRQAPSFASWLRTGRQGDVPIVLLSTASPSYGMFKNFEEKGDCFKKAIEK